LSSLRRPYLLDSEADEDVLCEAKAARTNQRFCGMPALRGLIECSVGTGERRSSMLKAIDMHVHGGPSLVPRKLLDHEVAIEAANAGMPAVVLKSHEGSTIERAQIAQAVAGNRLKVFGGIVLNSFVGGLNPFAVRSAIQMGAKIVWMPTFTARNHLDYERSRGLRVSVLSAVCQGTEGLSVVDEHGQVLPSVLEIVDLIAQANVVLCLGHLGLNEAKALVRVARERGVDKILLSHPDTPFTLVPLDEQKWFVSQRVMIERCVLDVIQEHTTWSRMAADIRETGIEWNIISTDLGQKANPAPVSGLELAHRELARGGFSNNELEKLMLAGPMSLLGLS
jgi:hypothetical protein